MIFLISFLFLFSWSQEKDSLESPQSESVKRTTLGPIQVYGQNPESFMLPTRPQKVSQSKMETYQYTDVNRALKQTSGVYVREEDGIGLRPNIGLRGTNPDRSKKIVLLEDDVLIGPAPYSAPAAYYTPFMNNIQSLDVYKGFSAVPYGPNSIGGAINYNSLNIPQTSTYKVSSSLGSFLTNNLKLSAGGPLSFGGYLIQASRLSSDGFKKLDSGEPTGFLQQNIFAKFKFDLPAESLFQHDLQLKTEFANEKSHETYLGLSEKDFFNSPFRRYSSSALDEMNWNHSKIQLKHTIGLTENTVIESQIYRHDFHRVWYRADRFNDPSISLRDVLNDPTTGTNSLFYNVLSGSADSSTLGTNGQIVLANNDRAYYSQGAQTRLISNFEDDYFKHDLELRLRYHQDQITRNHTSDRYNMVSGKLQKTADPTQLDTNNRDFASAILISAQDNLKLDSWIFTPALRFESARFENKNELVNTQGSRGSQVFIPGLSISKKINDLNSIRASVNKATSISGLDTTGQEQQEAAINYEAEWKYISPDRQEEFEITLFQNDYSNITGICSDSTGCNISQLDFQFGGGKAKINGTELRLGKSFVSNGFAVPVQFNMTYLDAKFQSEINSSSVEWGVGTITPGDPLPYIPKLQYMFSIGTDWGFIKQDFTVVYQTSSFDQSIPNGRLETQAYGIIDWAGYWEIFKGFKLNLKVDNILGRQYVTSMRPFGYRPGKPQSFMVGLSYEF